MRSDEAAASIALPLLRPDWALPPGVGAAMSTRAGGVSAPPWDSLNLGPAVGDDADAVAENRRRFAQALQAEPVWLRQVHGTRVLELHADNAPPDVPADAAWTRAPGVACTVMVADCLPVLLALDDGSAVAAAHAGWRGLAAGVLEATLQALQQGTGAAPGQISAWLGPCIGPRRFEVGADVLRAFGADPDAAADPQMRFFRPGRRAAAPSAAGHDDGRRWLADLPGLARQRLIALGLRQVNQARACTVEDASAFFSFRRDGRCGRMAAAIWRRRDGS